MRKPLVSIITVVYNARLTLQATIESVLGQNEGLVEYWIIDGGSTDGSINIISQYEPQLAGWISEPDKGIYDAMNKGVERATGDWVYFLGADDTLQPNVLKQLAPYLTQNYKVVFGDVLLSNGHVMHSSISCKTILHNTLHHQGTFYSRTLFTDFKYDQSMAIQADYELNLRAYVQRVPTKYIPLLIATYTLGGHSAGHTEESYGQTNTIRARYLKGSWQNVGLSAILRLYYWQKQLRFWLYGHLG